MSTRGAVAVRKNKGWVGVYNHSDSYPAGLGVEVFEHVAKHGIDTVARDLLKYGDWREYMSGGECVYCGKKSVGQPHSISGIISAHKYDPGSLSPEVRETIKRTGYPDPEAKHHEHGNGAENQMTHKTADALHIEWVYVLDPARYVIEVWASRRTGRKITQTNSRDERYERDEYEHFKVTEIKAPRTKLARAKGRILGEPNFGAIAELASQMKGEPWELT